jgi:hypothetical protein
VKVELRITETDATATSSIHQEGKTAPIITPELVRHDMDMSDLRTGTGR